MILDAGFLISVDRGERNARSFLAAANQSGVALHTTQPVIAQVWRNAPRQARLAAFVKTLTTHPLEDGRAVGQLLAQTSTTDVVDAHLVITALRMNRDILTGDTKDLMTLTATLGPAAPTVHGWP